MREKGSEGYTGRDRRDLRNTQEETEGILGIHRKRQKGSEGYTGRDSRDLRDTQEEREGI